MTPIYAARYLRPRLQRRIGRTVAEGPGVRTVPHHECLHCITRVSLHGALTICFVCRKNRVGEPVGKPLEESLNPVERIRRLLVLVETAEVRFRGEIVFVEDKADTPELEVQRQGPENIRRIGRVHYMNPPAKQQPVNQEEGLEKCRGVFPEISGDRPVRERIVVPVNVHALEHGMALIIFAEYRTENADLCPRLTQGQRNIPHPAVERHRLILNKQKNVLTSKYLRSVHARCSSHP